MKNNQYVMYLWQEIEMRRKEKEDRKKMMQNQKSNPENDEKKEKNQHNSIEKRILDKAKKNVRNELEVTKPGTTVYDFLINTKIDVSSGLKNVHESPNEPAKEDVGTSPRKNDVVQRGREPEVTVVQHGGFNQMSGSTTDQLFLNMPSQDQGSHATGVSFSRDPQAEISMPVTFLNREQETMTMGSSGLEQEHQQPQQQQQQPPPVSSLSFPNIDDQPATFLNLNQPQPVTSERSFNRENPPFGIGLSSTRGREPEVIVEQKGNQQAQEINENVVVGNNENRPASTSNNVSNVKEKEARVEASSSFWTACPYCYFMHEYPLDYVDCALKCQNCERAFQAVKVVAPPIVDGKEAYFCCWGFMPLGFSVEHYERSRNNVSSWSPFSPIFTCPSFGVNGGRTVKNNDVGGQSNVSTFGNLHAAGGSKSRAGRKHFAPWIYSDDDDDDDDGVSSGLKSVHESPNEPAKEDVGTSPQQDDVVQSPSQEKQQKIVEEDVGTFGQQY